MAGSIKTGKPRIFRQTLCRLGNRSLRCQCGHSAIFQDPVKCQSCGICVEVCPIEAAVIPKTFGTSKEELDDKDYEILVNMCGGRLDSKLLMTPFINGAWGGAWWPAVRMANARMKAMKRQKNRWQK